MVQMGVLSPESQKEQELKKLAQQDVVVVLPATAPPAVRAKSGCCSKRVTICVAAISILVALVLAGAALGLYLHHIHHYRCVDWGCGDDEVRMPFGQDYIIAGSDYGSSSSLIVEPYPYPEYGGHDGDHHGGHDGDHDGDHPGDHDGDHPGDHPSDHPGDHDGDHPGDHPGDHDGDHDGGRHGDHDGGHHGDHDGDRHGDGRPPAPRDPPRPVPVHRR